MVHYAGILEENGDVCSIRVPDLPGVHGAGDSAEAAIADTISAMREWAETMIADGHTIPSARTVTSVIRDPASEFAANGCESVILLPLLCDSGRPVKANLSIDAAMLEVIDTEAKRRGLTRSAFLVSAARDKIENQR